MAALVRLEEVDAECLALGTHPDFLEIIAAARREVEEGATLSLAEIKAELL